jgi:hypothetical protein
MDNGTSVRAIRSSVLREPPGSVNGDMRFLEVLASPANVIVRRCRIPFRLIVSHAEVSELFVQLSTREEPVVRQHNNS